MKRSEMLTKLGEILNSRVPQDYQFSTEELSDILVEIEDAGMQPPDKECSPIEGENPDDPVYIAMWDVELSSEEGLQSLQKALRAGGVLLDADELELLRKIGKDVEESES